MQTHLKDFFQHMNLLYAEDEVVSRTLYEEYFKKYFNQVYTAADGSQALKIFHEKKPDIVVLDINMPLLNGLEVCKTIRETDNETSIILLTARTDKQALLEAIELGLTTYLEKPVAKEQLNQALLKLADKLHQTNQIIFYNEQNKKFLWDNLKRELFCNSELLALTKKEKLLLELLLTTHHDKVSYEKIYDAVWSEDYGAHNYSELSIKTLIKKLRAKLPAGIIKNAYGIGYYIN